MERTAVEFTRITSTDSMDEHYLKVISDPRTVKLNVVDMEVERVEERAQWNNPLQFFLTILGFCVGLGNIWRFPYLCQQNGGGAFVLPFLIMMVLEGMPLLLLELGIGQKLRQGSFGVWNMIHPYLGGIGIGSTVIAVIVGCYYNMIIAWCFFYLGNSFWPVLPWSECPTTISPTTNVSTVVPECDMSSETQYFWYREALNITDSIDNFDGIRWIMFLCLIISWTVVYLIVMKGIQSSGYVVYFTALFPYVVLSIFFIRGITLKGATAGLTHMFYPKMESLLQPTVWLDAANQVFYSYGLAFGSIISFGSYNAQDTNCIRDVYLITLCNAFTAVFACAVVFAILGFKAQHLFDKCMLHDVTLILANSDFWPGRNATDISETEYRGLMTSHVSLNETMALKNCSLEDELNQAAQGTGLAFIVMADVFTKLPGAPFWSLLFFSMLLSLGLGSQIGILEGMIGPLFDIPSLKHIKKPIITGVACLVCASIGVLFTTGSGEYWLTLFDNYGAMGLTLIALAEIMSVMYVYGHKKFTQDLEDMTGVRPGWYWQITWRFVAPVLLVGILIASIIFQLTSSPRYSAWNKNTGKSDKQDYPTWTLVIAFLLAIASVVPMILIAVLRFFGFLKVDQSAYTAPMRRTDTNASTHPMMEDRVMEEDEDDRRSQCSSDSDGGIVVDGPNDDLPKH